MTEYAIRESTRNMPVMSSEVTTMRITRVKFTTRTVMAAVGICALMLWIAPLCLDYAWTWTVLRDVRRGQSTRYSPLGFSRAGPRAMEALREALKSNQIKVRLAAVQSIGDIARDQKAAVSELARPAVPDLVEAALHDPDRNVRIFAAVSLGQIGPGASDAVAPLIDLLTHEQDLQMVLVTVDALGLIGPGARPSLSALASMVNDPQHFARMFAARAMCRIGPEGRAKAVVVVPTLMTQLVEGKTPRARAWAAEILAEIGPLAQEAIPALSTAMQDGDPEVRAAVGHALEMVKSAVRETQNNNLKTP